MAITENNITINFINAASTKKIILLFENDQVTQVDKLHIQCVSQYGIEFAGAIDKLRLKNLNLTNAHLLENSKLIVENTSVFSSEAITTGLPIVTNQTEIKIDYSDNMLLIQKLLKGANIIPG